ncbi:MAG TPA: hypothetical protein VNK44_06995 [Candidatus Nitrosotenuis sp.]|nr:hypothetical protein [Candidatus Nitrosotenuis sp.]
MTGHVETILKDSNGDIIGYRQSDNVITNGGENCVVKLLFQDDGAGAGLGSATGTNVCTGSLNQPWHYIAIGTGSTAANGTDARLAAETGAAGLGRGIATTKTYSNSTGTSATTSASITLEKTFTNNSGGTITITESGLFNETSDSNTDSMFARQTFSGIAVNNGDSLTVRWTINIGGTQFALAQ